MDNIGRREMLKLGLLSSFLHVMPRQAGTEEKTTIGNKPKNILIIVFDALSACNINFYGHQRQTMPNLTILLNRATVYHNHHAGGPYTMPGTASLLTGTYPWTHRGFRLNSRISPECIDNNIFSLCNTFNRFSYTQNPVADVLLQQFSGKIDDYIPLLNLYMEDDWISHIFTKDYDIATLSKRQIVNPGNDITYSLILPGIYQHIDRISKDKVIKDYSDVFPRGFPHHGYIDEKYFTLEKPVDWLLDYIPTLQEPYLGYFHFLPPHYPYNTRMEFIDAFLGDSIRPLEKPEHFFSDGKKYRDLVFYYRMYDEYILYVDSIFGKLYNSLSESNALNNTILILTSDHGEMFERGIRGHSTSSLFMPVVHIPLVIFFPGQKERMDITTPTSAVDILPTLLHLSGEEIPGLCEGEVLPPFNDSMVDPERNIFTVHSGKYQKNKPITTGSIMLRKGKYKLTHYFGYELNNKDYTFSELYDIGTDPEEMHDLKMNEREILVDLLYILERNLFKADEPYK